MRPQPTFAEILLPYNGESEGGGQHQLRSRGHHKPAQPIYTSRISIYLDIFNINFIEIELRHLIMLRIHEYSRKLSKNEKKKLY